MRTTWLNYFEQHPNQTLVMAVSGAVIGYVASESYMGALAGAAVSVANSRTCSPRAAIFAALVSAALKRAGETFIWNNHYISLASVPIAILLTRSELIAYCAASSLAGPFVPSVIDAVVRYKLPLIGMGMVGAEIFWSAILGLTISDLIIGNNNRSEFDVLFKEIPVFTVLTALSGMGSYSVYFSNYYFHLGMIPVIATAASIINLRERFFQGLMRRKDCSIQTLQREKRELEQRLASESQRLQREVQGIQQLQQARAAAEQRLGAPNLFSPPAQFLPAEEIPVWVYEDLVFKEFECAINKTPLVDPVLDPTDGVNLYERTAIENWLRTNSVSPTTRRPLRKEELIALPKLKVLLKHRAEFYKTKIEGIGKILPDPKLVEEAKTELLEKARVQQAAPGQEAQPNAEVVKKFEKFLPNEPRE